jgi:hypothetical protein
MRYTGLIFILILFSCTKESIPDTLPDQSPVFHVQGDLNGESFLYQAGENNMVMETEIASIKGVASFVGKLTDGIDFIELSIQDGNIDLIQGNWVDELPQQLNFSTLSNESLTTLSKEYFSNHEIIESVVWMIDGEYAGTNEVPIYEPGIHQVCAKVNFEDGSEATLCNDLIIGYKKNATSHLRHFLAPNGSFQAWLDNSTCDVENVKWFVDGNYFGSEPKLLTTLEKGIYEIVAEVTFSNGAKRILKVSVDGNLTGHYIDDLTIFEDIENEYFADHSVALTVKRNGQTYRSLTADNEESVFHINKMQLFGTSPQGNPIIQLNIEVNCLLQNVLTGQQIPFVMNGVFGVEVDP